jgi:CP family cyanate transporter-like MFS transporter
MAMVERCMARGSTNSIEAIAAGHPHRWMMLGAVWLLYLCFGLTSASLAPLVGPITKDLGVGHAAMGVVFGAWQLVYIISAAPGGAAMDRIGPRKTLFFAGLMIAASGIFRASADTYGIFLIAVAVFGLGGPLVSVGAPKVIALWFDSKDRAFAMGIYITGPSLGAITSLAITNPLLMPLFDYDWRAVLLFYAVITAIATAIWLLISSHAEARRVEASLRNAPREPQLLVWKELLRLPTVQLMLIMSVGIFFLNHGLNNWLPTLLRDKGLPPTSADLWAMIPTAVGVAGSLIIPRLAKRERRYFILLALLLSALTATVLMHLSPGIGLATGLTLQGIARSSLMTVAILILVEMPEIGARRAGAASGLFFSAAEIGGVTGPLALGAISEMSGGFDSALWLLSGIIILLIFLATRLTR